MRTPKKCKKSAKEIFDEAQSRLNTARTETNVSIEKLGKLKYEIYEQSIIPFAETFQKVKNVNFKDSFGIDTGLKLTKEELQSFCQSVLAIEGVAGLRGLDGVGGDLDSAIGAVLETHRAGEAAGQLAVALALGGARADGAPADQFADELGR